MFIGREKELNALSAELSSWKKKTAVLIYGKRRVGKSTLINEAAKVFDGIVVNHLCVTSTFEGNLELIYKSISESLSFQKSFLGASLHLRREKTFDILLVNFCYTKPAIKLIIMDTFRLYLDCFLLNAEVWYH